MASSGLTDHQHTLYKRWRTITFISMFLGWGCYMLVRKTFPSSMQSLMQYQGFTKDNIGMIASSFSLAYGVSKFLASIVSDHVSPRKLFVMGLMMNGLCCVVFPASKSVTVACSVWFIAGLVQGLGWAPCAVLLKTWYPPSQIGTWWSVLSSAGNIASGLSPLLILYITRLFDWTMSYYLIGMTSFILGSVMLYSVKDSPNEIGVDSSILQNPQQTLKRSGGVSTRWYDVFLIVDLWIVGLVYAGLYCVKDGVLSWIQLFMIEVGKKPEAMAAGSVGMVQLGGMAGNLVIGFVSDMLLVKRADKCPRAPMLLGLSVCLVGAIHVFRTSVGEETSELWLTVVNFSVGFLVDGAIAVVGLCSMEVVPHHMAGSAHGLACAVGQVGSVMTGWPFAYVMEHHSWNMAYWVVELSSISMVVLCVYLVAVMVTSSRKSSKLKQ